MAIVVVIYNYGKHGREVCKITLLNQYLQPTFSPYKVIVVTLLFNIRLYFKSI